MSGSIVPVMWLTCPASAAVRLPKASTTHHDGIEVTPETNEPFFEFATGRPEVDPNVAKESSILEAVDANNQILHRVQAQLEGLCDGMVSILNRPSAPVVAEPAEPADTESNRNRIEVLENEVSELTQQNSDLASQVASSNIQQTVTSSNGANEAISWEERKKLILNQMETDTFDADAFVSSLATEKDVIQTPGEDPVGYVLRLNDELSRREEEIRDLQHLLESKSANSEEGVSIGAMAIAERIDSDDLVREEREKLQRLQNEWEEKFRQGEVEASLERAKLSRERRELVNKQSRLDAELESIRLKALQKSEKDGPRKWLDQLGLAR